MDWVYREGVVTHAHQLKCTLYKTTTPPIHQQLYLQRKRLREEWDPFAREVPLQPLLKHHKAHRDPIEWEILPMTDSGVDVP